jgi:release factor glutamine methyltransferase
VSFPAPRTVAEAIRAATELLGPRTDTARYDAEVLMAFALGTARSDLFLRRMSDAAPPEFEELVARRAAHEPVAYITGEAPFWGLTLRVSPAVLIPRADSETLIEAARSAFSARPPARVLDLGTGSGCLLLAALHEFPAASGLGIDRSREALDVARANAAALGLEARAELRAGDWTAPGWDAAPGTFDLILANPPYVESDAALEAQVREYEPAGALFAGADGLDDYRVLIPQLPGLLADDGLALVEIGHQQGDAVTALARAAGLEAALHRDLGGRPRALGLRKALGKKPLGKGAASA